MIATLDDVIEEILDTAGIYGAHGNIDDDEFPCPDRLKDMCRVCAAIYLRTSIENAMDVERRLYGRKEANVSPI